MSSCAMSSLTHRLYVLLGLLLHIGIQTVYTQSINTTPKEVSRWDEFLTIPPEYVALIGLGICFFLLFVVVIILICITGRGKKMF